MNKKESLKQSIEQWYERNQLLLKKEATELGLKTRRGRKVNSAIKYIDKFDNSISYMNPQCYYSTYVYQPAGYNTFFYRQGTANNGSYPKELFTVYMPASVFSFAWPVSQSVYDSTTVDYIIERNKGYPLRCLLHYRMFLHNGVRKQCMPNKACLGTSPEWNPYSGYNSLADIINTYWSTAFNDDYGIEWMQFPVMRKLSKYAYEFGLGNDSYACFSAWEKLDEQQVNDLFS